MKKNSKIYAVEYKVPRGRTWYLWDMAVSSDLKEVQKEGEEWWGKDGYGRDGYKYRVVTFERVSP